MTWSVNVFVPWLGVSWSLNCPREKSKWHRSIFGSQLLTHQTSSWCHWGVSDSIPRKATKKKIPKNLLVGANNSCEELIERAVSVKNKEWVVPSNLLNYGNVITSSFFIFCIYKPVLQNCPSFIQTLTTVHTHPSSAVINYLVDMLCEVTNCTFAINLGSNFLDFVSLPIHLRQER